MNNPKSVSEWVNRTASSIVEKLCKDQMKQLGESLSTLKLGKDIAVALNQGIQEGRRQEVERAKNYLKRLCWNDKDIELFEKWQSRNEGSEKK